MIRPRIVTLSAGRRFGHAVKCAPLTISHRLISQTPNSPPPTQPSPIRPSPQLHLSSKTPGDLSKQHTFTPAVELRRDALLVNRAQGGLKLSLLWLRDSCTCPLCVDPDSGQKNFSTVDLPVTPQVRSAKLTDDGSLSVIWKNETTTTSEDQSIHSSVWPAATLDYWADNILTGERLSNFTPAKRTLWNRAKYNALLSHGICRITHADWTSSSNPAAFERALDQLSKTGLIFVTDVPNKEDEVERIGQRIGMLQHTFYGTTWDVKSKPRAENVAYTSQFLGLHQDLMYHEPIPRLQLLHCLANSCEGGESLFSDGVRAAYAMQIEHPELYNVLTWFSVPFHYRSKDGQHHYEAQWPTIEIDRKTKYIKGTHWAPPFQAPFRMPFPGLVEKGGFLAKWKEAAAVFHAMLASPENMVKVKLKPGECIIFDNSRVLHGRNEFKTGGEGDRWLKGTYVSPQVFTARQYRMQMEEDGRPKRRIRLRGMDGKVTIGGDQNDTTRLLKSERSQVKAMLGLLED